MKYIFLVLTYKFSSISYDLMLFSCTLSLPVWISLSAEKLSVNFILFFTSLIKTMG